MSEHSAKQTSASFFLAAERCLTERHCEDETMAITPVPGIVCRVFSIELGFKAMLMTGGDAAQGHKLSTLFQKLRPSLQDEIIQSVGIDRASFVNELTHMDNAFVQWRYVYEYEEIQINFSFLNKLAEATQNVATIVDGA